MKQSMSISQGAPAAPSKQKAKGLRFGKLPIVVCVMLAVLLIPDLTYAQGVATSVSNVAAQIIAIANFAFPALAVMGVLASVFMAVVQNPRWKQAFVFTLIAFAIWGGFETYKTEIFTHFGGGETIGTGATPAGGGGGGGSI